MSTFLLHFLTINMKMKWPMNRSLQLLKPPTTPSQHLLLLICHWRIVAATVLLIFLQKEIAAKMMEFVYLKQIQLSSDVSWIMSSHLQPSYPSYGTMRLTNVLRNTTVRYRISATQLKLHWIVGVTREPNHFLLSKIWSHFRKCPLSFKIQWWEDVIGGCTSIDAWTNGYFTYFQVSFHSH